MNKAFKNIHQCLLRKTLMGRKINVSNLEKGFYIVRVHTSNSCFISKFIVQ